MIEALTISLIVLFLHVITWNGMILDFVPATMRSVPAYLKKPLFSCPTCMTIWWGFPISGFGMVHDSWSFANFWQVVITVLAAGGITAVLSYVLEAGKAVAKAYLEMECDCQPKSKKSEARRARLYNQLTDKQ